ncbi:MAG: YHYH protein, partial [Alcanivoracaceae bacterium]
QSTAGLVGFAKDGFPIYGPLDDGSVPTGLDECNGMSINGLYGYFVTDDFPYLMNCLKGTPDPSFDLVP